PPHAAPLGLPRPPRHNREMLELLRDALREVASLDLATAIAKLVRAAVDAHLVDPALHRVFDEQVPRMGQLAKIEALEGETFLLVRSYLAERRNEISVRDLDSATSLLVTPADPPTSSSSTTPMRGTATATGSSARSRGWSWAICSDEAPDHHLCQPVPAPELVPGLTPPAMLPFGCGTHLTLFRSDMISASLASCLH